MYAAYSQTSVESNALLCKVALRKSFQNLCFCQPPKKSLSVKNFCQRMTGLGCLVPQFWNVCGTVTLLYRGKHCMTFENFGQRMIGLPFANLEARSMLILLSTLSRYIMYIYICIYLYAYMHACIHACMHAYIHVCI